MAIYSVALASCGFEVPVVPGLVATIRGEGVKIRRRRE